MLLRSQTSWAYIPCVTATGTSRPPAPPAVTASMRVLIGWPINSRTRNKKEKWKKQPAATSVQILICFENCGCKLGTRVSIDRWEAGSWVWGWFSAFIFSLLRFPIVFSAYWKQILIYFICKHSLTHTHTHTYTRMHTNRKQSQQTLACPVSTSCP